ncbi:hypothetical protein CANCADRAFT_44776 [Tortispora caseinolytica NRRL Y-17796]|uniref:DASH complex subunit SPC34 n=1 Tax=Tortispora caseinolytica NRRL Y-17796 TaxID=767744 RepID=A0A1E4THE1_9ASCO|nr:hypothetical protein CANCADRAFT_44776 [Tortispora caseinolytica NRRL Y-17796]
MAISDLLSDLTESSVSIATAHFEKPGPFSNAVIRQSDVTVLLKDATPEELEHVDSPKSKRQVNIDPYMGVDRICIRVRTLLQKCPDSELQNRLAIVQQKLSQQDRRLDELDRQIAEEEELLRSFNES